MTQARATCAEVVARTASSTSRKSTSRRGPSLPSCTSDSSRGALCSRAMSTTQTESSTTAKVCRSCLHPSLLVGQSSSRSHFGDMLLFYLRRASLGCFCWSVLRAPQSDPTEPSHL